MFTISKKFYLSQEEADNLIERLEYIGQREYIPICKCSICGEMCDDAYEPHHHIVNNFGYESKYKENMLDIDLCHDYYDAIINKYSLKLKRKLYMIILYGVAQRLFY